MIDPIIQDTINYENEVAKQAALDQRIDDATTEGMTTLSPTELWNALTEIDIDGRAKPDSPEDYFHNLLIWVRNTAQKEQAKGALPKNDLERSIYRMIKESHRRFDVEPGWDED